MSKTQEDIELIPNEEQLNEALFTIEDIIKYATHVPHNSNPNVLRSMLMELSNIDNNSNLDEVQEKDLLFNESTGYLGFTWSEISNMPNDFNLYIQINEQKIYITNVLNFLEEYSIIFENGAHFITNSPSGFPQYMEQEQLQ